ncbi:MAG: hypothetical protein VCA36_04935, partial [Opitutales bacterium]
MNYFRYALFSLLGIGFATGFGGCGEDPTILSEEKDPETKTGDFQKPQGTGTVAEEKEPKVAAPLAVDHEQLPVPEISNAVPAPGPKWTGLSGEFTSVFGGRGMPNELPRLFVNATAAPYTGSINKLFANGDPEFSGNYQDGYLEGVARWWNNDGSLASVGLMKGGKVVKWEIQAQAEIPASNKDEPDPAPDPIFVGTNESLDNWTTVANLGGEQYLLEKKTGEKVTGAVKVHDASGRLTTYKEYQKGK